MSGFISVPTRRFICLHVLLNLGPMLYFADLIFRSVPQVIKSKAHIEFPDHIFGPFQVLTFHRIASTFASCFSPRTYLAKRTSRLPK